MNGKPDAYSLISCAAFAIMSLSLSRQTQCGFEIDLLYFFLGCLIVQLMKLKLQLFILGAGFSYCLIILRSSFSSLDTGENGQYSSELQDGNSVILYVDSLQSPSVDNNISLQTPSVNNNISSATSSIDSTQLVISTNIGSMMDQLGTYVKALEHENSNLIQIISEHVKKYVEEHSQLVVSDPNLMMDALKLETINDVEEIAKVMMMAGFEKDFSDVYNNCRRECLDKCLTHRLFGLQKLSIEDVHNMSWKDLEDKIERWIRTFNVALKILFPGERRLCDRIFCGFSSAADFSFMEICRESTIQLLNFVDYVSSGSHSPERLFKILEVFETLRDLIPEFASLFCDQYSLSLRNEATAIWKRVGKTIRDIFKELEYLIGRDLTEVTNFGGGLHPITQHVMNYLRVVCGSQQTLEQVFYDSSLASKIRRIMDTLESNLEAKSICYEDSSLGYIFLINNHTYIVEMTKDNELGTLLGDDWLQKYAAKVRHYHTQCKKTTEAIPSTLVLDFFRSKYNGGEVSKVYQEDMKEIEIPPSQPEERYQNFIIQKQFKIQNNLFWFQVQNAK